MATRTYEDDWWQIIRTLPKKNFIKALPQDLQAELVRYNTYSKWLASTSEAVPVLTLKHDREVTCVINDPENGTIITLTENGGLSEYKLRTGQKLRDGQIRPLPAEKKPRQPGHAAQVEEQAQEEPKESLWSVEKVGMYLFVASQFGAIYRIDYDSFQQLDGKRVADGYVKVRESLGRLFWASYTALVAWDPATLQEVKRFTDIPYAPAALQSKGRLLLCDMWESPERKKNQLVLYDSSTYGVLQRFEAPLTIFSTEISPPYVMAGLQDGDVLVWNMETGEKVRALKLHRKLVYALHSVGNLLVTGSNDFDLAMWNLEDGELVRHSKDKHLGWVNSVKISPNGSIISGSEDKSVHVWKLASNLIWGCDSPAMQH